MSIIDIYVYHRTFSAEFEYLTNDGSVFYFKTTLNAPNRRIVKIDIKNDHKEWIEVIPESHHVLDDCMVNDQDKLILVYLAHVKVITIG